MKTIRTLAQSTGVSFRFYFWKAGSIALFFLASVSALNAQSKIDSLENVLSNSTGNSRAEILYMLSWEYRFSDKEKALAYGKEGLDLGRKLKDTTAIASSLNSIAETHLNFGEFELAEQLTWEELPYAKALLPKSKYYLGSLVRLGTVNYRRGKLDSALVYQLEVQREAEKIQKPDILGVSAINLGLTYMDLKKYADALKYFDTSLQAFQSINFDAGIGACYVNIAEVLRNQKQFQAALDSAEQGVEVLKRSGNELHLGYMYGIMADLYRATGKNSAYLEYAQKALSLAEKSGDELTIAQSQSKLGRAFLEAGDMAKSEQYFRSSLQLAEKMQHKSMLLENYVNLRDWNLLQKNFVEAGMYDQQFQSGLDSTFNAKMAEKVADAQTKYETEKKEVEIARQNLELLHQRIWIFGLLAGLVALILLGFFLYNRYRMRQRAELAAAVIREQKLGLNAVIEAQENERKRIAKDLHDGIAQELVALKLGFNLLQHRIQKTAPEEIKPLDELLLQLDNSCSEVRSIAHTMMPPTLEQHGLAPSLELLLRHTAEPAGLIAEFESQDLPVQLDQRVQVGLYRVAQELLNNVVKHAQAKKVCIRLFPAGNELVLQVEDDGRGFDFEAARQKGTMGVLNILSRVATLGGSFVSARSQQGGTAAVVRVPI